MKKNKIANVVMVAVIILIAAAGIFSAGHIRGRFDKPDEGAALLTDFRGIITLQRDGVAYTVSEDTLLREGDKITCSPDATVKISLNGNYAVLGQNAGAEIINPASDGFILKVNTGEAFVNTDGSVLLEFAGRQAEISNAVVSLSVRKGAQSISVYSGSVGEANAGQMLEWVGDGKAVRAFSVRSLNDFNISQIRKANKTKALVFSDNELDELENERFEQMNGSSESTEVCSTAKAPTSAYTENTTAAEKPTKKEAAASTTEKKEPTATARPSEPEPRTKAEKTTKPVTTKKAEATKAATTKPVTTKKAEATKAATKPVTTEAKEKLTCTITIRCDTILDNTENLDPAKAPYVPDNGVILREVTVEFEEGETVFDVLNRACKQYNIPIELNDE